MRPIIAFFRDMTGLEPTKEQADFLHKAINKKFPQQLISAGRQSGKSLCVAVVLMWYLFEFKTVIHIQIISAQRQYVYFHMVEVFKKHPELMKELTERSLMGKDVIPIEGFTLKKGSMLQLAQATLKSVMGFPADIIVIDEACQVPNDVIKYALGCLTGENAKFILLSTPDIDTSLFVEWLNNPKSGFKIFTWSGDKEHCPWHNEK